MTNTKFRKRALLSSVAMLLVALVALGSATFAWFSTNPTVTATGLSGKAAVSASLQIAHRAFTNTDTAADITGATGTGDMDKSWSKSILISEENTNLQNMIPVSPLWTSSGVTFYTASSAGTSVTDYTMAGNKVTGTSTSDLYRTKVWLKSEMQGIAKVTATATISGTAANYSRVAIVPVDAQDQPLVLAQANEKSSPITAVDGSTSVATFGAEETYAASGDLTDISGIGVGQAYYVYIWFEGQDPQCYDANAGKTLTVDLSFTQA